jgi:hypothetical protein
VVVNPQQEVPLAAVMVPYDSPCMSSRASVARYLVTSGKGARRCLPARHASVDSRKVVHQPFA